MNLLSRDFTKTAVPGPIAVGAGRVFSSAAYDPLKILPPKTRRVMT
jgi:hypothetical protein